MMRMVMTVMAMAVIIELNEKNNSSPIISLSISPSFSFNPMLLNELYFLEKNYPSVSLFDIEKFSCINSKKEKKTAQELYLFQIIALVDVGVDDFVILPSMSTRKH